MLFEQSKRREEARLEVQIVLHTPDASFKPEGRVTLRAYLIHFAYYDRRRKTLNYI